MTEPPIPSTRTSTPARSGRPAENLQTIELPHSSGDIGGISAREAPPGTPRWVKVFGIIAIVLLLALAGLHLTGYAPTHGMPMHSVMLP